MITQDEIQLWLIQKVAAQSGISADKIDINKPIQGYGLESIEMIEITGDLETWLQTRLPPNLISDYPTIKKLSGYLAKTSAADNKNKALHMPKKTENIHLFPLAYRQEWLYAHPQENLNITFFMHINEHLNIRKFRKAVNIIVKRHDNLRSNFKMIDGEPKQYVSNESSLNIPIIRLSYSTFKEDDLPTAVKKISQSAFATEKNSTDSQLMHCLVIKKNKNEYAVLFQFHHLIFDGFSLFIFLRELKLIYNSLINTNKCSIASLPIQYSDYVDWQRNNLSEKILLDHLEYWRNKLADVPPVFHNKNITGRYSATYQLSLPLIHAEKVKGLALEAQCTPFLILFSIYNLLIHYYSSMDDMVVSFVDANRVPHVTRSLIGYFSNHLFIRSQYFLKQSYNDYLQSLKNEYSDCIKHASVPFGKMPATLEKEYGLSQDEQLAVAHGRILFNFIKVPANLQKPLTDHSSFFHGGDFRSESWEGEIDYTNSPKNIRYLYLRIILAEEKYFGIFNYAKDLFSKNQAHLFMEAYQHCVNDVISNPTLPIIDLITKRLVKLNDTMLSEDNNNG